ncbi:MULTISPECIES: hypothetical protein [unclassified Dietzia]|uniref:hypothetical protein n=1 Tax=unclassified Dietzia TaxID=2617939 RepID=UPI001F5070FB|nr:MULTISPECIES: hypothetical protein [unclassified Dietzia]
MPSVSIVAPVLAVPARPDMGDVLAVLGGGRAVNLGAVAVSGRRRVRLRGSVFRMRHQ